MLLLLNALAKARLATLGEALDLVEAVVVLLDPDMRAWFANERFAELWGLPREFLAAGPSFRDLLEVAASKRRFAVAQGDLPAFVDHCEAEVRAAAAAPTPFPLSNGRRLLLRCVVGADGGRIVIFADDARVVLEEEQRQTREAAEQLEAELRFNKETLEEQASYLASLAEDSDANARRAEEANRLLEHEITERRQLEAELQRLATTDPLTGTLNRRQLFNLAREEFNRARKRGNGLAVLMLDIDHFKRINDSHGHPAGDEALRQLAERLRAGVRQADLVGRLGGEEFAVVLPAITLQAALRVAASLRAAVEAMPLSHGTRSINMTISIGVSVMRDADDSIEQVIARADEALYQAKEGAGTASATPSLLARSANAPARAARSPRPRPAHVACRTPVRAACTSCHSQAPGSGAPPQHAAARRGLFATTCAQPKQRCTTVGPSIPSSNALFRHARCEPSLASCIVGAPTERMWHMKSLSVIAALAVTSLAGTAVAQPPPATSVPAPPPTVTAPPIVPGAPVAALTDRDAQFIAAQLEDNVVQVLAAQSALARSQNQSVRDFAQKLINDHTYAQSALQPVASIHHIELPTTLNDRHRAMLDRLNQLTGPAFDRAYVSDMVNDHVVMISAFNAELPVVVDSQVSAWTQNTRPMLLQHQEIAQQLLTSLPPSG